MAVEILIALGAAALLIGATGTWSPCGFSMVETIGPTGHSGGQPTTLAACLTFLPGALVGAIVTFGGLALAGSLIPGEAGWLSYTIAMAVALVAAVAEARGARIAPQIRRQLPEHWRRVMPMPVAAALYGVLLGLGFTTFVLTFGVWALAGISLALGEPAAGLAIGLGFGIGRAIPVVSLAPFAARPLGRRAITLMAERPALYRAIRLGDAAALLVAGIVLAFTGVAQADVKRVKGASDPSVSGSTLAFAQGQGDTAYVNDGSGKVELPGTDPAISDSFVAVIRGGDSVAILSRPAYTEVDSFNASGVDAVAVSNNWVVYRTRTKGNDEMFARQLAAGVAGEAQRLDGAQKPSQLGIPSLDGSTLVYAAASRKKNQILTWGLAGGDRRVVMASKKFGLSNPSVRGTSLLYVRTTKGHDELRLKKISNRKSGRRLMRGNRLWSTALSADRAYVTALKGGKPTARITSVNR